MKTTLILTFCLIVTLFFSCKTEEIILHGDLTGLVNDASNNQPIQAADIRLAPTNDPSTTGVDGSYLFRNLIPGEYEIKASKSNYGESKKIVEVLSAKTVQVDFLLNGIPVPKISVPFLDFGTDSTRLSFTISNIGRGKLTYFLAPSKDWIIVEPLYGDK